MNKRFFAILLLGITLLTACIPTSQASPARATADQTTIGTTGVPTEYEGKLKLFILAGQSNMSGRGAVPAALKHTNPRVYVFGNDYQWKLAEEPVDSAAGQVDMVSEDRDAGMSPSLNFAETLLDPKPEWVIGLIPCAKNSTSLLEWQQNEDPKSLYGSCLKRIREAMQIGTPAGILFYQGETDTYDPVLYPHKKILPAEQWAGEFGQWVKAWRSDLGDANLPVVFAQIGTNEDPRSLIHWEVIKKQQASVNLPNVRMIKTDDLELGDAVHLTVEGYIEVGRRFAEAFLQIIK
jgi:hypothetical protein